MSKMRGQIGAAMEAGTLIRLTRTFEEGEVCGYVLDLGAEWFVLALVSDRINFDGFECFRIEDTLTVEADPRVDFVEAALSARSDSKPVRSPVSAASLPELLSSANRAFPLVTFHKEALEPDLCQVGKVVGFADGEVWLHEIDPDAAWEDEAFPHLLTDITRVNFGGGYEEALNLVGGPAPAIDPQIGAPRGVDETPPFGTIH